MHAVGRRGGLLHAAGSSCLCEPRASAHAWQLGPKAAMYDSTPARNTPCACLRCSFLAAHQVHKKETASLGFNDKARQYGRGRMHVCCMCACSMGQGRGQLRCADRKARQAKNQSTKRARMTRPTCTGVGVELASLSKLPVPHHPYEQCAHSIRFCNPADATAGPIRSWV
jgi:hypothetical protein